MKTLQPESSNKTTLRNKTMYFTKLRFTIISSFIFIALMSTAAFSSTASGSSLNELLFGNLPGGPSTINASTIIIKLKASIISQPVFVPENQQTDEEATVTSDKSDYLPGETVIITGSGWLPNETVSLVLREDPSRHPDTTLSAVADSEGNIQNMEFKPNDEHVGVTFTLTATGSASNRMAETQFTDGGALTYGYNPGTTGTLIYQTGAGMAVTDTEQVYYIDQYVEAPKTDIQAGSGAITFNASLSVEPISNSNPLPSNWVRSNFASPLVTTFPGSSSNITLNPKKNTGDRQTWRIFVKVPVGTQAGTYKARIKATPDSTGIANSYTIGLGTELVVKVMDNAPPNSTATGKTINPGGNVVQDPYNGNFTKHDVRVTLNATDIGLGVASTEYYFNNDSTNKTIYNGPFTITTEGTTIVRFRSTDVEGNIESWKAYTVKIDKSNPTLNLPSDITQSADGNTNSAVVTFNATASDSISSATVSCLPASGSTFTGTTIVSCTATDAAGNTATGSFNVTVQASNRSLSISKTGAGSGIITSNPSGINCGSNCSSSFTNGASVTLTATAASGSTFAGWSGDGTTNGDVTRTVSMSADRSVTAKFKANQTISFAANTPTSKSYGDTAFNVTATGGASGNVVSYAAKAASTCTVTDNNNGTAQVSNLAVGNCVIVASQTGNDDYNAAQNVEHTIGINKANQATLSVASPTAGTFGQFYTMTSSGGSGTGAVSYTVVAGSTGCSILNAPNTTNHGKLQITNGSGTCSITASKAFDDNYNVANSLPFAVEISKADQIIAWSNPAGITYGTALGATQLNASLTTGNGALTYNPVADTVLGAGTRTLRVDAAETTNYKPAFKEVSLTVNKATAEIVLSDLEQTYSGLAKSATATTNPAGLSGVTLTYSQNNATVQSPTNAGSYAVVATLSNNNYELPEVSGVRQVTGTLVIAKAGATIALSGLSHTYDGSAKSATVTKDPTTLTGVSVTYDGSETAPTTAGSYPVVATLVNNNYKLVNAQGADISQVSGTLTIARAAGSVSISNLPNGAIFGGSFTPTLTNAGDGIASFISISTDYCTVSTSGVVSFIKAGSCSLKSSVTQGTNHLVANNTQSFMIAKRGATIEYTGQTYAATTGASAPVALSAKVTRGGAGDLALARVQFTVKKFTGAILGTPFYAMSDANGIATVTPPPSIAIADDPYTVEVQIDSANNYWMSGIEVSSLTVIQGSGVGRTAGGGWIPDAANTINGKSNFGFTVTNERNGIKGNSVFIYRVMEGSNQVQYVVKSNSWQGGGLVFNVNGDATKASFTGRATLQRYVNGIQDTSYSGGNHSFTVDVFDGDLKNPRVPDGYAILVLNSSGTAVKQLGNRAVPVTLGGGNVLIQK